MFALLSTNSVSFSFMDRATSFAPRPANYPFNVKIASVFDIKLKLNIELRP